MVESFVKRNVAERGDMFDPLAIADPLVCPVRVELVHEHDVEARQQKGVRDVSPTDAPIDEEGRTLRFRPLAPTARWHRGPPGCPPPEYRNPLPPIPEVLQPRCGRGWRRGGAAGDEEWPCARYVWSNTKDVVFGRGNHYLGSPVVPEGDALEVLGDHVRAKRKTLVMQRSCCDPSIRAMVSQRP